MLNSPRILVSCNMYFLGRLNGGLPCTLLGAWDDDGDCVSRKNHTFPVCLLSKKDALAAVKAVTRGFRSNLRWCTEPVRAPMRYSSSLLITRSGVMLFVALRPCPFLRASPWCRGISPSLSGTRLSSMVSRIGSAPASRQVSSNALRQELFTYSHTRAFDGESQILRRRNLTYRGTNLHSPTMATVGP